MAMYSIQVYTGVTVVDAQGMLGLVIYCHLLVYLRLVCYDVKVEKMSVFTGSRATHVRKKAHGGELKDDDSDNMCTFIQYIHIVT